MVASKTVSIVTRDRRCCGFFLGFSDSDRRRFICEWSRDANLSKIRRMRTFEYRLAAALALLGLLSVQSAACEPPAGFVNPPRPDIAPLDELLSHTEEIDVARPLSAAAQSGNRPLEEAIRPTKDLPGVSGTFRLSNGPYGSVGARRLVCLTDGNMAVEEVLLTESKDDGSRFRYVVWNYTSPKFRDVSYAVGEIVRTQRASDKTHVVWTYRFALKSGLDAEDAARFRKDFLEPQFAVWMRSQLERGRSRAEAMP